MSAGWGVGWGGVGVGKSARSTLEVELCFPPVAGRAYSPPCAVVSGCGGGGVGWGGGDKSARSTLDFELYFLPVAGRVYRRKP